MCVGGSTCGRVRVRMIIILIPLKKIIQQYIHKLLKLNVNQ